MKIVIPVSAIILATVFISCNQTKFSKKSDEIKSAQHNYISKNDTVRINLSENIATPENIENLVKTGSAKFITFGIAMQDFKKFRDKYGVDLKSNGCVITGNSGSIAALNNQYLAKYLTEKYGDTWKQDLPFLPFGLE